MRTSGSRLAANNRSMAGCIIQNNTSAVDADSIISPTGRVSMMSERCEAEDDENEWLIRRVGSLWLPSSTDEVAIIVVRSSNSSSGIVRSKNSRFSALWVIITDKKRYVVCQG